MALMRPYLIWFCTRYFERWSWW